MWENAAESAEYEQSAGTRAPVSLNEVAIVQVAVLKKMCMNNDPCVQSNQLQSWLMSKCIVV